MAVLIAIPYSIEIPAVGPREEEEKVVASSERVNDVDEMFVVKELYPDESGILFLEDLFEVPRPTDML